MAEVTLASLARMMENLALEVRAIREYTDKTAKELRNDVQIMNDRLHKIEARVTRIEKSSRATSSMGLTHYDILPTEDVAIAPGVELPSAFDVGDSALIDDLPSVNPTLRNLEAMDPEVLPKEPAVPSHSLADAASSPPMKLVSRVNLHPLCAQILHRPGRIGCSHFIKLKTTSIGSPDNLREDLMKQQWRPPPSVSVSRSSRYLGLRQPLPVHGLQRA
jgi:hypothetical protein